MGISPVHAEWKVLRIDGRDYVDVRDVAAFYGLPSTAVPVNRSMTFSAGKEGLTFTADSREARINGVLHWLNFPVLEREAQWLVSRMDLAKTVHPAMRPTAVENFPPITTVVLDAGHGAHDRGAYSPVAYEKDFTLDMVRRIRPLLERAGLKVVQTRNSDVFLELTHRAAIANRLKNSIFVSIHFNSTDTNPLANGFEMYCVTPRGSPSTEYDELRVRDMVKEDGNTSDEPSFVLATTVHHSLIGRMDMADRGVKRARFSVLRNCSRPSILIEGGFLSNGGDLRKIADRAWRDRYAAAIAAGILQYKLLVDQKIAPKTVPDYKSQ